MTSISAIKSLADISVSTVRAVRVDKVDRPTDQSKGILLSE
jgi:hypothetical protein